MNSNIFVCELSKDNQDKIKSLVHKYLNEEGYDEESIQEIIENVMLERLWNIEEIINIEPFLEGGKVIDICQYKYKL